MGTVAATILAKVKDVSDSRFTLEPLKVGQLPRVRG
jgi:hypothetical protein